MTLVKLMILGLVFAATTANAADICSPCDFDNSGTITTIDHAVFLGAYGKAAGQPGFDSRVDYDGSGTITSKDFSVYLKFCIKGGN